MKLGPLPIYVIAPKKTAEIDIATMCASCRAIKLRTSEILLISIPYNPIDAVRTVK